MLAEGRDPAGWPYVLEYRWGGWEPNRALRGLDRDPPEMRMTGKMVAELRGDHLLDRHHQDSFERPTHFLLRNCTHEAPVEATTFPPIFGI
jgi:hypothetical protein